MKTLGHPSFQFVDNHDMPHPRSTVSDRRRESSRVNATVSRQGVRQCHNRSTASLLGLAVWGA
jgi:hypothetical protein